MIPQESLVKAVRRERAILVGALVVVIALAWAHMIRMGSAMASPASCHAAVTMQRARAWSTGDLVTAAAMWSVMMVAMMLPVVTPWLVAIVESARQRKAPLFQETGIFLLGYGFIWLMYSVAAAAGQLLLQRRALLSQEWVTTSPVLASALLASAGIYQWTPLRDACMAHCRTPFGFFLTSWRAGRWGALTMGVRHGLYCLGCCWALMALSFVFGAMNLVWMAGLTAFLLLEKATAGGRWMSKTAGGLLVAYALWMFVIGG